MVYYLLLLMRIPYFREIVTSHLLKPCWIVRKLLLLLNLIKIGSFLLKKDLHKSLILRVSSKDDVNPANVPFLEKKVRKE